VKRFLVLLVLLLVGTEAFAAEPYVRFGLARESSGNAIVVDRDCASTEPPALFGCGVGARGEFGDATGFELAAGAEGARARVELAVTERRGLRLRANANFTDAGDEQPVRADASSRAAMLIASIDVAPDTWLIRPFVSIGAGMARNELGTTTYDFPGLSSGALTIVPGGTNDAFAFTAAAGASVQVATGLYVDLAARYNDLGEFRSEAGESLIVRADRTLRIPIDATRADLRTSGISLSIRWRLGKP
jgi:opacity protein-like surface antigen